MSYFCAVIALSLVLAYSMMTQRSQRSNSGLIIFQILILFVVLRSLYYLATKNSIPFGDAFWDYAVQKAFVQENQIFLIESAIKPVEAGSVSQLTWYSGWPMLHSFGLAFTLITGIDPLYLNLILPYVFSIVSFGFTYLLVENLRSNLGAPREITYLTLLIYTVSPGNIWWQIQFVRQNLGMMLFTIILYLASLLYTLRNPKHFIALVIVSCFLVMTHHFTAFVATLFFGITLLLLILRNLSSKLTFFPRVINTMVPVVSLSWWMLGITSLMTTFTLLWWIPLRGILGPTIIERIRGLIAILQGFTFQLWAPSVPYPPPLQPWGIPLLLRIRDIAVYGAGVIGFVLLLRNRQSQKTPYLIYSSLALGIIFVITNVFFALEPFRVLMLAMPILAAVVAIFIHQLHTRVRAYRFRITRLGTAIFIFLLIFPSFVGLWAHNFAPTHLYDPSVDPVTLGEVQPEYIRLQSFVNESVALATLQTIWTDSQDELLYLFNYTAYHKIQQITSTNYLEIGERSPELICIVRDLVLYRYYAHIWQPVQDYREAEDLRVILVEAITSTTNHIYDDGVNTLYLTN
jgi:hypothetical protein